jgi:hypothetical protein
MTVILRATSMPIGSARIGISTGRRQLVVTNRALLAGCWPSNAFLRRR